MRLSLEEAKQREEEQQQQAKQAQADERMDEDDEEILKQAMQMSLHDQGQKNPPPEQFIDQGFVSEILRGLGDVDVNDPSLQAALQRLARPEENPEEEQASDDPPEGDPLEDDKTK